MSDLDPNLRRSYQNDGSRAGMWAGILLAAFVIVVGLILLLPKGANDTATGPGAGTTTGAAPQGGSPPRSPGSSNTPSR